MLLSGILFREGQENVEGTEQSSHPKMHRSNKNVEEVSNTLCSGKIRQPA